MFGKGTCFYFAVLGYNLSPTAIQIIVNRYSTNHRISFDDFVACAVRLRSLTGEFHAYVEQL